MSARTTASDRMRRVLAVVPWIVANPGHTVADVAARFGLSEKALLSDLDVVFMVGLPPYSPDSLVDVQIDDDGRVSIHLADFFSRPLRLTPAQALALLAASDALLSVPGADPDGALARAFVKLRQALGIDADSAIDIHLGDVSDGVLDLLRTAMTEIRPVTITYYSFGRDERSTRRITPWRVFADAGAWYVHAWCERADGERVFRVDRIESAEAHDEPSPHGPPSDLDAGGVYNPRADDPVVTLRLTPEAAWVAEYYPATVIDRTPDHIDVELVVSERPWLERLLLRLGPQADLVSAPGMDGAATLVSDAAARVLSRYEVERTGANELPTTSR
ncbi:MAG: WYL domain-containing protein [Actinomycetota bacterium]